MKVVFERGLPRPAAEHAAEAAEVAQVQKELREIYALAPQIKDEETLQALLLQVPGEHDRKAVEALLRQFVTFPPADVPDQA